MSLVSSYWEGTSLRLFSREAIAGLFLPRGNDLPLSDHWASTDGKNEGFLHIFQDSGDLVLCSRPAGSQGRSKLS